MPRIQPLTALLRPLHAPRTATCTHHLCFSTATRLFAQPLTPSKPSPPLRAPPVSPKTPQEAARAADLAAAEAITESDSAQPPAPKPDLPSQRAHASKQTTSRPNNDVFPGLRQKSPTSTPSTRSSPPATLTIDLPPPKYHVSRSKNGNFPIYTDYKRGGNLHLTTVRKITGDLSALRDELRVWLNKKNEDVKINPLTAQVVIKGHCKEEVQKFLEGRGF